MQGEQLQTSTLGLVHTITRHDMNPGHPTIKIKCVASIYTAYYKTVEIIVGRKMRRRKSKRRRNELSKVASDQKGEAKQPVSLARNQLHIQALSSHPASLAWLVGDRCTH